MRTFRRGRSGDAAAINPRHLLIWLWAIGLRQTIIFARRSPSSRFRVEDICGSAAAHLREQRKWGP
jgi:hypothetical protein